MESTHSLTAEEVLRRFGVRESCGLSAEQVRRHREKYGANGKKAGTCPGTEAALRGTAGVAG